MGNTKDNSKSSNILQSMSISAFIQVFFAIFLIVLFLKSFVIEFYRVESGSMEPELYKGDFVVVSRVAYFFGLPSRFPLTGFRLPSSARLYFKSPQLGDVVVIDAIESANLFDDKFIVKRVTGIPGDTIVVEENSIGIRYYLKKSTVSILTEFFVIPRVDSELIINSSNFRKYQSILINENVDTYDLRTKLESNPDFSMKLRIKNNYYFVQGDNYKVSSDSRAFGLIPEKSIIGKTVIMFLSHHKNTKKRFMRLI